MTKEIAMKWITALRSGKYEQYIAGRIAKNSESNCVCCLGVLSKEMKLGKSFTSYIEYPTEILTNHEADQSIFIDMNDTKKLSFNQIADYIESHMDELTRGE